MRIALAGGGTGGHVVPGLHLLANARPGELGDVLWFSSGRRVEEPVFAQLLATAGAVPFERCVLPLEPAGGGAPRSRDLLLRTPQAVRRCRRALRAHSTEVLLGLGGFTSLPAVLAARSLRLPVALLEVNAVPGRATRHLGRLAQRIFHAWPPSTPSARDIHCGPPLPPELTHASERPVADPAARLLVLGGSQGAGSLNEFVRAHSSELARVGVEVVHQVGPGRLGEAAPAREGYFPAEFLDDVPAQLLRATFVLCRGGASTLAELAAAGTPGWVVPYPHHPDEHQRRNAERLGAGVRVVSEEELVGELPALLALLGPDGSSRRAEMRTALERAVPRDGALRILSELGALAHPGADRRVRSNDP